MPFETQVVEVPTYYGAAGDAWQGKAEFDAPHVPVTIFDAAGIRLVLGVRDPFAPEAPDIQVERRPGGWCVFIHADDGDERGYVYILDDGRVQFQPAEWEPARVLFATDDVPKELDMPPEAELNVGAYI